ncbi:copper resistance protein NlpE N-terminal domain-containing protein [Chitinophaga nivalis]|uniref:Copper resistance protein NlpE N-terminal domain-containing protein n=1 Tax=Chitinophaga nivalis TaxID=2991709 RepID=A0ABT3IUK8_9BACT|nr:copper resistance protein NlpE N-terminal domain-containing protein [Chitinophaga nivalis]MCW3462641.1 copper resistance protein NlpE N-terminal domain-containing protein [Chitinophaga nivalis]MCW3487668.1 copper resistance protein NlpE N-terminal domain-containing protein [Chitinophaga nivalis]
MRNLLYLSSLLLATLAACNNNTPDNTSGTDSTTQVTHPVPTLAINGTYQGTLPCADCPGMDYQVSLYDDHTFSELTAYQGRGKGGASVEKGTWKQLNDSTVVLIKSTDSSTTFLASEGNLLLLDAKGHRVEGVLASNYVLKPVEGGDLRTQQAEKLQAGIRFTAHGNEPGWSLDLEQQQLFFSTINGDSIRTRLPAPNPNTDSLKVYTTPEITISIRNTVCADDMSGFMQPNSVELKTRQQTYHGCGQYLK